MPPLSSCLRAIFQLIETQPLSLLLLMRAGKPLENNKTNQNQKKVKTYNKNINDM